jgi:hypothetical protein
MDGLKALSERSQNPSAGQPAAPWHTRHKQMPQARQAFEPRRTVHTITEEIPILDSMSPKLTPVRNSMRLSAGTFAFRSAISRCNAPVYRTSRY